MIPSELLADVFEYFARDAMGPLFSVSRTSEHDTHPMHARVAEQLALLPTDRVEFVKEDPLFVFHHPNHLGEALDLFARQWLLIELLAEAIPAERRRLLTSPTPRPAPYSHPALQDLDLTDDLLVPLSAFQYHRGALRRSDFVFSVVPVTESVNSSYWFTAAFAQYCQGTGYVRLDPLLCAKLDDYQGLEYKMLVYGRSLDWDRLARLREPEHGRWLPGRLTTGVRSTEYVWAPRADGVHFQCEELVGPDRTAHWGSRYLHGVYDPDGGRFTHFDGAIRFMTEAEAAFRDGVHVRHSGKVGVRVKVARCDDGLTREQFVDLCPQFFVWNYDIARYCGADVPPDL